MAQTHIELHLVSLPPEVMEGAAEGLARDHVTEGLACVVCGAEGADVKLASESTTRDFARGAAIASAQCYRVVSCRQCGIVYELRDK